MIIGFIGLGFIGKNYADDFEERGYTVIRYSKDSFSENKNAIATCDIVFIAVPTPTTVQGFDDSVLRAVLPLVGAGKVAVIKSTVQAGTTERLQAEFPDRIVMHSPEFLREKTAAEDARHPERNIIGIVQESHRVHAERVMCTLAPAPYNAIIPIRTAELVKYASNCFLTTKVIFMNLLYDLAEAEGAEWGPLRDALIHDPRIGESHTMPVHQSGHGGPAGRGAGGHCFVKDFAAFREMYATHVPHDTAGLSALRALEEKNAALLRESGKDLELLKETYGA